MSRLKDITPTREHTGDELAMKAVISKTMARVAQLAEERKVHTDFLESARAICAHDWRGQRDEHPHGTPRETFICTICLKEEVR